MTVADAIGSSERFVLTSPSRERRMDHCLNRNPYSSGRQLIVGKDFHEGMSTLEKEKQVLRMHRVVWEHCAQHGPCLIFEDDAWFIGHNPRFLETEFADGSIYFLGATIPEVGQVHDGYCQLKSCLGVHAYLLTKGAAKLLISQGDRIPVDLMTKTAVESGEASGFMPIPLMFVQLDRESSVARRYDFDRRYSDITGKVDIKSMIPDSARHRTMMKDCP